MENKLPEEWSELQLEDLLISLESGSRPKGGVRGIGNGIPSVGGEHLNDYGSFNFTNIKYVPEKFALKMNRGQIKNEDILIVKDGATTGKTSYVNCNFPYKQAVVNEHVFICRARNEIFSKFLFYFLWSSEGNNRILDNFKGSAQGGINTGFVSNVLIPLPPLPEQHRIVASLDAIMERMERNKKRLDKIPALLKRFRQSVLADALSGVLFETRSAWIEVELNSLIDKGGIFDGPFGSNLKTDDYVDKGVRVIRLENVEHLSFVKEKKKFITDEKYSTLMRHTVGEGDIIFSSFISEEIRACILPNLDTKAVAKADCFCIRPNIKKIDKKFLLLSLVSRNSYDQLVQNIHGATRPRINTTQLKKLILSIPPLEEQQEIVLHVEQLFAFADKVEARYAKAKILLDKLPQSILAKAFRGELVAQDENDEPASVLLKRIEAAKLSTGKAKK